MEQLLNSLLVTLGQISVSGKDNMDHLLGAILAIESALEQMKIKEETEGESNGG